MSLRDKPWYSYVFHCFTQPYNYVLHCFTQPYNYVLHCFTQTSTKTRFTFSSHII